MRQFESERVCESFNDDEKEGTIWWFGDAKMQR